jgi:hypothetical protein
LKPCSTGALACGAPSYDAGRNAGVFLWRECGGPGWQVRATAGGGSAITYAGSVSSNGAFSSVRPYSLENLDRLTTRTDPPRIDFSMTVVQNWEDGFGFAYPDSAGACFRVAEPSGTAVLVGPSRERVVPPFDPRTLGRCQ